MKKNNNSQTYKPKQKLGFRIVIYIMIAAMLISTLAFGLSVIISKS